MWRRDTKETQEAKEAKEEKVGGEGRHLGVVHAMEGDQVAGE